MNRNGTLIVLATVNLALCVLAVLSYSRIGRMSDSVIGVVDKMEQPEREVQSITRDNITTERRWVLVNGTWAHETVDDWMLRHDEAVRRFYKP